MKHLMPFQPRTVMSLPVAERNGWRLKRYAILSEGRAHDRDVQSAAFDAAIRRLPEAGALGDTDGNHGIGFQIVHFAEVAVVSPVFYWQWGSVLASIDQMRAPWSAPTDFGPGVREVVGCAWEMEIVIFEVSAWMKTVLGDAGGSEAGLRDYLACRLPSAKTETERAGA